MAVALHRISLDEGAWEALFDFLDPARPAKTGPARDREAVDGCRDVMRRLALFFAARRCPDADDLAEETMIRVAGKCRQVIVGSQGERLAYFYGVARHVLQEWRRETQHEGAAIEALGREPALRARAAPRGAEMAERAHGCVERCMTTLSPGDQELIIGYYAVEKSVKIESRRKLAAERGRTANALRIEVHRIMKGLRRCVVGCVNPETPSPESRASLAR
jgi:DNA-directed RNA polymerase specialized sigma24 family protein